MNRPILFERLKLGRIEDVIKTLSLFADKIKNTNYQKVPSRLKLHNA